MTRKELEKRLIRAGIDAGDAAEEAVILMTHFGNITPPLLFATPAFSLDTPAFADAVSRREKREPLAYILGEAHFFNEVYYVTPDVLIPRFDTEVLVEKALSGIPRGATVCDLCTGSGCVGISLLAARPDLRCDAYDISEKALALAEKNAERNAVKSRMRFIKADLLTLTDLKESYGAILSNPPYIPRHDLNGLPSETQSEPRLALDGGEDGMIFYRHFLQHFRKNLLPGGKFYLEIGYDEKAAILAEAEKAALNACVYSDYGGRDRVAVIQ